MNYNELSSLPFLHTFGLFLLPLIAVLVLWTLVIKGFALWKSARNGHKVWFVILLIANTLGILELVYLIWFAKPKTAVAPQTPGA